MGYGHCAANGKHLELPVGKVVCVGRNYAEHARELNNPVPTEPLLFIKPSTAIVTINEPIQLPKGPGPCHFETELAVLIGKTLTSADNQTAAEAVAGYGLGLDLTLRELQGELKQKGHPWEKAKAFDGSCPLSGFVAANEIANVEDTEYRMWLNGELQQRGDTKQMLTPVFELLAYISGYFTLLPGDVVLTGTPAGVGVLNSGDELRLQLADVLETTTRVTA